MDANASLRVLKSCGVGDEGTAQALDSTLEEVFKAGGKDDDRKLRRAKTPRKIIVDCLRGVGLDSREGRVAVRVAWEADRS